MSQRNRLALPIALLVGLAALSGSAHAVVTKSITDRKGDSRTGFPDISSASVRTTPLYVTVTVHAYKPFGVAAAPCASFTHKRPAVGDEFVVCGDGSVQDFQHGRTAGRARVSQPAPDTVVYVVSRATLRHPSLIGWAIQVRGGRADACIRRFHDVCDAAPQGPGARVYQS
ncbi:MAG: hypothetical protein QOE65_1270 [Solirubrobacteraceae bacterium]|nr:hypothetical protein [Solirubrobacteraceae bacterium]